MSSSGRHRSQRRTPGTARRVAGVATLAAAAALAAIWLPQTANADAPMQVGWWNMLSGGGQSMPEPQTPAGGMHVAAIPNQDLAFGAVLYSGVPAGASATVEFKVENLVALPPPPNPNAPSTNPTISVQACPTKTNTWKSGDDQPVADAPAYDCDAAHFAGNLSADGKTLTFLVDSTGQTVPGTLSLAILPLQIQTVPQGVGNAPVDTTEPFSFDLDKPDETSLMVTSAPTTPTGGTGSAHQAYRPPASSGTGSSSGGSQPAPAGNSGSVALPPVTGGGLPAGATTTDNSATAPIVAPTTAPAATQTAPAAALAPTDSKTAHNAALAMLILLGLALLLAGQRQPGRAPRLLGGAARNAAPTPSPALAGIIGGAGNAGLSPEQVTALLAATMPSRGLGRFSKPRTGSPRPLI